MQNMNENKLTNEKENFYCIQFVKVAGTKKHDKSNKKKSRNNTKKFNVFSVET